MKKCSICKQDKELTQFNKNKTKKDGLQTICKICSRERFKRYYEENTKSHKKATAFRAKHYRHKMRDYLNAIRMHNGCALCNETALCCIEFHHFKKKEIPLTAGCCSLKKINTELAKCVCLCRNCHKKVHAGLLSVNGSQLCVIPDNLTP